MEDQSLVFTLDEALGAVGFGNFQALVLAYAGLGWFAEATEFMLITFVGPEVESEWGLSSGQESLLTTVVFAGMLIGAYSWGLISDTYGRRKGFLGMAMLTSGAGFLSAFSPNYISLLIFRFLVAIGLGGGPVFKSWFLEFVPAQKRGTWMVVHSTFWTFGTMFEASLAWIVMTRLNWRWLLAFSSIPAFALLFFYTLVPESPRFLCMKGNTVDAHHILEKIAQFNQTEIPSGILVSNAEERQDEEFDPTEETHLLSSTKKKPEELKKGLSLFFILFSSSFSSNNPSPMVAHIYAPELYPTSVRTTGAGVANAMGRIGGMICPLVAVGLVTDCHQTAAIILFEAVIVLSAISALLLPFETKGQELSDNLAVSKSTEVPEFGD